MIIKFQLNKLSPKILRALLADFFSPRRAAGLALFNLLLAAILLMILATKFAWRFDLTANHRHSLSPASRQLLAQLNDPLVIKAFISSNLPAQLMSWRQDLIWFLKDYQRAGHGRVKLYFFNPDKDASAAKKAQQLGIPPLQFSSINHDKFQLSQGYLGLTLAFADRETTIAPITSLASLEYQLAAAIKKLTSRRLPLVAFSQGSGETPSSQLQLLDKLLRQGYRQEELNLSAAAAHYDDQIDVLVVNNPQQPLSRGGLLVIDQLLQHGKGVLILDDGFRVENSPQLGLWASKINNGLDKFLSHYGFQREAELIVDPMAALAVFRGQAGNFLLAYPFWPKISANGVNQTIPALNQLSGMVFPWVAPLKVKGTTWLLKTSPASYLAANPTNLNPAKKVAAKEKSRGAKIIAALRLRGGKSYFSAPAPGQLAKLKIRHFQENCPQMKLAVVGDGDFIKDSHLRQHPENASFFLNLLDYLRQDNSLLAIRSKPFRNRQLRPLRRGEKQALEIANFAFPLFFFVVLYFWQRRR